mgnify:CR=1 FL=1
MLWLMTSLALALESGEKAPDFELKSLSGETVKLSDLKGKLVVLEWFNPGCPFVKYSHGEKVMSKTIAQTVSEDTVWLAINSGAPGKQGAAPSANEKASSKWNLQHPVLLDPTGAVGTLYSAKTTPHMFIIDKEGKLAYQGAHDNAPRGRVKGEYVDYVKQAISELKAGQKVSTVETKPYGCSVKYK